MGVLVFGYALTVVVTLAVALLVLLLERRRAREIETDPERLPTSSGSMRKENVRKPL